MIKSLYTDGSTAWANPSPYGIAWALIAVDENDQEVYRKVGKLLTSECKGFKASNNLAEVLPAVLGLEYLVAEKFKAQVGNVVEFYSDSELTLNRLFNHYSMKLLPGNVKKRAAAALDFLLLKNHIKIKPVLLAGHPTKADLAQGFKIKKGHKYPVSKWNVVCDKLASEAAATMIPMSVLSRQGEKAVVTKQRAT